MLCGAARRVINPEPGHALSGYSGDIFCTGVHDDLTVDALYLSDGRAAALVLCYDLLYLPRELEPRLRRAAADATGMPADHVVCTCTHTHSGPAMSPGHSSQPDVVRAYLRRLTRWTHEAAADAKASVERCDLRFNFAPVAQNMNRRFYFPDRRHLYIPEHKQLIGLSPDYVDRELGILAFRRHGRSSQYKAVLTNYTSHPLCVGNTSTQASADYQGVIRAAFEESFTGSLCVATTGAAGDNHPLRPEGGFVAAREMGSAIAREGIARVYDAADGSYDERLRVKRISVRLRRRDEATRTMHPAAPVRKRNPRRREGGWIRTEVGLIGVGPVLLVGLPGEPASALGAMLKWSSPFPRTYVLFHAVGGTGYMPTANQFLWGGYEAASCPLASGEGERLIHATLEAARGLVKSQPLNLPPAEWLATGMAQKV
ncbi:MAG: hypothetical protein BIFFINMI_00021 [Phycisphaerae bacterium]|nr:hypothetical protein [Phycisphaerae bacterium]